MLEAIALIGMLIRLCRKIAEENSYVCLCDFDCGDNGELPNGEVKNSWGESI